MEQQMEVGQSVDELAIKEDQALAARSPTRTSGPPANEGRSVSEKKIAAPVVNSSPKFVQCLSCHTISLISLRRMKRGLSDPFAYLQKPYHSISPQEDFQRPLTNYKTLGLLANKSSAELVDTPTRHLTHITKGNLKW